MPKRTGWSTDERGGRLNLYEGHQVLRVHPVFHTAGNEGSIVLERAKLIVLGIGEIVHDAGTTSFGGDMHVVG